MPKLDPDYDKIKDAALVMTTTTTTTGTTRA